MARKIINELTPLIKELKDLKNKEKMNLVSTMGVKRKNDSTVSSESGQNHIFWTGH